MRRALALAAVLLLSGLLPLAASTGLCAGASCCHESAATAVSSGAQPACCSDASSTPARNAEATIATIATPHLNVVAIATAPLTLPSTERVIERFDLGSPPTSRRLATLSVLLI